MLLPHLVPPSLSKLDPGARLPSFASPCGANCVHLGVQYRYSPSTATIEPHSSPVTLLATFASADDCLVLAPQPRRTGFKGICAESACLLPDSDRIASY